MPKPPKQALKVTERQRRSIGLPKQSWWVGLARGEFVEKQKGEQLRQSISFFGNKNDPKTAEGF